MKTQKLVIASAVCLFTAFGAFLQKKKSKPDFKKNI